MMYTSTCAMANESEAEITLSIANMLNPRYASGISKQN